MKMHDENSGPKVSQMKRVEQIKRWEESDINKESVESRQANKIKFSDSTIFLAACSANDIDEIKKLIKKGADLNTTNIDGLSALHQACIDDNLRMVQFLVQQGADINQGDNEGWTPLHAAASCGFLDIVEYLMKSGANVAAVNSDGDLPIDITESVEIEKYLQDEIDRRGISIEDARNEEMDKMMRDVKLWLRTNVIRDRPHPKTGATALHVAAAKGYIPIIKLLVDAGVNVNAQDFDGWTPLHAAFHWNQKEAVKALLESKADPNQLNNMLLTPVEVGDNEMNQFFEDIKTESFKVGKERMASSSSTSSLASNKTPPTVSPSLGRKGGTNIVNSGVTRMSGWGKTNLNLKDHMDEHETLAVTRQLRRKTSTEDDESTSNTAPSISKTPALAAFKKVKTSSDPVPFMNTIDNTAFVGTKNNQGKMATKASPDLKAVQFSITTKTINKDGTIAATTTQSPSSNKATTPVQRTIQHNVVVNSQSSPKIMPFGAPSTGSKGKSTNTVPPLARTESTTTSSSDSSASSEDEASSTSEEEETRSEDVKSSGQKLGVANSKVVSKPTSLSIKNALFNSQPVSKNMSPSLGSKPVGTAKYPYSPKAEGHKESNSSTTSSTSSTSASSASTSSTTNLSDGSQPSTPKKPSTLVTPIPNAATSTKNSSAYDISSHRYQNRPEYCSPTNHTSMLGGLASKYSLTTPPTSPPAISPSQLGSSKCPSEGGQNHALSSLASNAKGSVRYLPHQRSLEESRSFALTTLASGTATRSLDESPIYYFIGSDHHQPITANNHHARVTTLSPPNGNGEAEACPSTATFVFTSPVLQKSFQNGDCEVVKDSTNTFATLLQRYQRNCATTIAPSSARPPSTPYYPNPPYHWAFAGASPLNQSQTNLSVSRVEESSEAQRKVRSKRARESRRSTQGVTPEDIKAAERQLEDIEKEKVPSKSPTSSPAPNQEPQIREEIGIQTPPSLPTTTASPLPQNNDTTPLGKKEKTARVFPLKIEAPVVAPIADLSLSNKSRVATTNHEYDSQSSHHNNSSVSSGNTSLTTNNHTNNNPSSRRPVRDYEERRRLLEEQRQKAIEERKNALNSGSADASSPTPNSLEVKRHLREKRRSTGICTYSGESDGVQSLKLFESTKNNISDDEQSNKATFDSETTRGRPFTSNRSLASSDELSRDYKKLYEEEKSENVQLKARVKELEGEIKASKSERKALAEVRPTDYDNSDSFVARREKRVLERKVLELEEEIKKMESLKEANQRLKHENGALIRVISKLSK